MTDENRNRLTSEEWVSAMEAGDNPHRMLSREEWQSAVTAGDIHWTDQRRCLAIERFDRP
jgi:hypothetical protein